MGMKLVKVSNKDLELISKWYHERNKEAPPRSLYPRTGYMVPGVAAGFLYETDSSICKLDGYISNPSTTEEERDEALDLITTALLDKAGYEGFDLCMVMTKSTAVIRRAEKHGFKNKGDYKFLVKEGL